LHITKPSEKICVDPFVYAIRALNESKATKAKDVSYEEPFEPSLTHMNKF